MFFALSIFSTHSIIWATAVGRRLSVQAYDKIPVQRSLPPSLNGVSEACPALTDFRAIEGRVPAFLAQNTSRMGCELRSFSKSCT